MDKKILSVRVLAFHIFCVLSLLTSCSKDDTEDSPPQPQKVTRWECILFGSYPANEVVGGSFSAVDDYALLDGDVITDATLYNQLEQAVWTDDDTEIGGKRYHRLNGAGAVTCSTNREQHYRWGDTEEWHYFAYAPIKWRILKISGTKAVLLADRMPDTCPFHDKDEDVNWSGSLLRHWLNSEFLGRAFSEAVRSSAGPSRNRREAPSRRRMSRTPPTTISVPTVVLTPRTVCSCSRKARRSHRHWPLNTASATATAGTILPAVSALRSMPSAVGHGGRL